MIFHIDKRFETRVVRDERVLEIAELYGLGLDAKEFVVFDNEDLEINQEDVVYVTGDSGGGKSLLLRELRAQMESLGVTTFNINEAPQLDKPIISQIGANVSEAQRLLGIAGVSEANMWLRTPSQLSDGQNYRFRLAKAIESGAQVWFADEFLAILDRDSARLVAFNMQKVARHAGATLIVATTHSDMVADLNPSLMIRKKYGKKMMIVRPPKGFKQCITQEQ